MKSSLEALPIELVERIVTLLDLRDIASLRLTNRNIESKASQGYFTTFFYHKNIMLCTNTLENMVRVTSRGRLGCQLRYCTITGISGLYVATTLDLHDYARLLTEAFLNLKKFSPRGRLASLCLRVIARAQDSDGGLREPETFHAWRDIWTTALHIFDVTMLALNESHTSVDEYLDVFGGTIGCSLAYGAFLSLTEKFPSMDSLRSLKKLMLSLSSSHTYPTEQLTNTATTAPEGLCQSILQMSGIMPELESLDLHWYDVGSNMPPTLVQSTTSLKNNSHSKFARLKECSLRGVYVSENELLEFVKAVHPAALTMADVHLISGTYTSIFEYLTLSETPVTYYHLDDIREGIDLVHFDVPGGPKFRYQDINMGPSTLIRQMDHVKEPIQYRITRRRPLGSGERRRWCESKYREYGPLRQAVYDFVELNSPVDFPASDNSEDG
ncbi:uncharacterized protein F4807DRAFT_420288 [Annulohypoxylon truncatum]|uniref:uncharacterized protein n=1 Tax=Annulohypoxylon truncatum TaxID=327061 RepID=UPI0020083347|nr:uncharacterized protein F4807DRAFT_420288 [Annulohypoxylon truncatum]KAI1211402.1 hypothetical protein F4807DRAFT_420288 [Annulohypoxylon truncatum]